MAFNLMPPFGSAIDVLFGDPHLAFHALWRQEGGDPALPVRVIVRRPDRIGAFGETRLVTATMAFDLRVVEAPTLAEGDTIEVNGELYIVQGEPLRDAALLIWTAEARPV